METVLTQEENLIQIREAIIKDYGRYGNYDEAVIHKRFDTLQDMVLGNKPFDKAFLVNILVNQNCHFSERFLISLLIGNLNRYYNVSNGWNVLSIDHSFIKNFCKPEFANIQNISHIVNYYLNVLLQSIELPKYNEYIQFIQNQGFTDEYIITQGLSFGDNPFEKTILVNEQREKRETIYAVYIKEQFTAKKGVFGLLGLNTSKSDVFFNYIRNSSHIYNKKDILKFLLKNFSDILNENLDVFLLEKDYNQNINFNTDSLKQFFENNFPNINEIVLQIIKEKAFKFRSRFDAYLLLNKHFNNKYFNELEILGEELLTKYNHPDATINYYDDFNNCYLGDSVVAYFDILLSKDETIGKARIHKYLEESRFVSVKLLKFISQKFDKDSVPYLLKAMMKDPKDVELSYEGYFVNLFQLLEKYDISEHLEKIFYFALNLANAKARKTACLFLTQYSSLVEDPALELLKGKKADERIVAALVLTKSQRKEVIDVLFNCLETETNDEIRDLMLHALQELKFDHVFTKDEVQLMVAQADKRKKLNNWTEKLIDETALNTLKWHDQELISQKELRFLMYRSKRAKGLNSDLEAKPMLALIDKNSASDFCLTLLKAFQDSNADNKLKYYLSLGAFLGGDQVLNRLHSIFKTAITDKRYKLAESLVGAMAMVGSNKALRLAELISRQFINKKPAIAAAAKEALVAAAEELQISAVQLADRIIPDLGFDGLYKNIEINGEEYRAFVSADFKLNYLNADNKLRKSLPKEAPKDLAKECKAIETEIADVVKTQKGRLENLMVQEFVWAADEWLQYYYNNPIMNVYVQKVLWAVFDTENQFVTAFYCNEDLIFCDLNDDEVAIDDAQFIKILHPLYLTETELQDWKDKLYDLGLVTMFPILERSIVHLPLNNTDEFVVDYNFKNADIPKGADFVAGFLQKRGWIKSTGDGGSLQFGKIDELREIQAYADIEGPAAYFQGGATKATAHNVGFFKKSWNNKVKVAEMSPVFYSETVADILDLIKA